MGELSASLTHQVECNLSVIPSKVITLVESTDGSNTSKTKLSSRLSGEKNDSMRGKWADLNPLEVLNGEIERSDFLRKILEEIEGGWTFQAKKKTKERVDTIHPESNQSPHPSTRASIVPGGKRGQMYSELHQSFFNSLGIPLPTNVDLCRARVWPVLTREKGPQKEVLIHSKNQELPNLLIGIRIIGDGREDWSSKPAMDELIQHITIGLEENVLRHKLLLKDQLGLEWSWQVELSRGGSECTILAHIPIGSNLVSIQNKKHLHWKAIKSISSMNNKIEFVAPAHNLLLKKGVEGEESQVHKKKAASRQTSPQAARKKRFTPLDLGRFQTPNVAIHNTTTITNRKTSNGNGMKIAFGGASYHRD